MQPLITQYPVNLTVSKITNICMYCTMFRITVTWNVF